jgi:phosphoribosylformylglycinamidine synthase subunit PurL
MNKIEKALMHALFVHLHHNTDRAVNFSAIEEVNRKVAENTGPGILTIGPGDDAAVFKISQDQDISMVAKMESHCSPCVPNPYDAAHTCVDGSLRDVVAMGGRPLVFLNFVGTKPLKEKVLVGPCGFKGTCSCGKCVEMTSKDRLELIMKGIRNACQTMNVLIIGGGFSTSFSDIVPAVVGAAIGRLVTEKPLTKPAKKAGDKIILIGQTSNDGNDTLYRAGLVTQMRPAVPALEKEKIAMEATLAALKTEKCHACSDLGAAGIGAAVCESARYGGLGAAVDLSKVEVKVKDITPEEILICETQARYAVQTDPDNTEQVLKAARDKGATAEVIGEINSDNKQIFTYKGKTIAVIPNQPSEEELKELETV